MRLLAACLLLMGMSGCTSIAQIGILGPKELAVYRISDSDFLTATRMLVILDEQGNVLAYTGGTAQGGGAVGLQAVSSLAVAGSVIYSAQRLSEAIRGATLDVKGIPSAIRLMPGSSTGAP